MASREVALGEVCEIKQGKYLSPGQMAEQASGEAVVPVIGGNGILGYTTESTFSFPLPLVTCRGSKCGLMQWAEPPTWISNNAMAVYFKDGLGDNYFLYQFFLQSDFDDVTTGSAQPQITVSNLALKRLVLPDPKTQSAIAQMMRILEQKIELNSQMSTTLEETAQAIFKSWFIDFDPVKAKMLGSKPVGMNNLTAPLFPDSLVDSEIGPIPKNWPICPLTDFFEVLSGGTPKTTESSFWGGSIPWFSVVDAPETGGCFFIKTEKTITDSGVSKSAAKIVRPGVTVISARGTVGKTAIVALPSTFNQSCYGLMGKHGDFYTYLLVKNQVAKLKSISHGGMFDTITRDTFSALKSSNPGEKVIGAFERLVEPMFMQIRNLQFESEQIFQIRDALLPRLISGELQIPEEMTVS
jgi:restriction endonuclease S subunit